jgi:DnaK suppressor protein
MKKSSNFSQSYNYKSQIDATNNNKNNNGNFTSSLESESDDFIQVINPSNFKKTKITIEDIQNLPKDYLPSEEEDYMNRNHYIYFYSSLSNLRHQYTKDIDGVDSNIISLRDFSDSDEVDIASRYTEMSNALLQKERLINLVKKIDQLLSQIEDGVYGYCQETSQKIGIKRLLANPTATKCIQVQTKIEIESIIAKNNIEDE